MAEGADRHSRSLPNTKGQGMSDRVRIPNSPNTTGTVIDYPDEDLITVAWDHGPTITMREALTEPVPRAKAEAEPTTTPKTKRRLADTT